MSLPDDWSPDADMWLRHLLDDLVEDTSDLGAWKHSGRIDDHAYGRRRAELLASVRGEVQLRCWPRSGAS